MDGVLVNVCGFIFMIALSYGLKRIGLFKAEDSAVLSKLLLKVTLPMTIINNFQGLEINRFYVASIFLGLAVNFVAIGACFVVGRSFSPQKKAFYILNVAGLNIGVCTLPFVQSLFSKDVVAIVCMFDVGNAIMCFGVTYTVAMLVSRGAAAVGPKEIGKTLFSSMPFVTYLVMITLCVLHIALPKPVYQIAGLMAQANPLLAMTIIGLMFEPKFNRSELKDMAGVITLRLSIAAVLAWCIYHYFPAPLLYRKVLAVIIFSPIFSIAPIFTERCGYNRSVAAVLNSVMLPLSMVIMGGLFLVLGV